jgi:signal peptidase I
MFSFKEILNKYGRRQVIRGLFALVIYICWVIWLNNYWFLLGLPIVTDMYLTKRVNWTPWKKKDQNNHFLIEWFDALIFAVIAVTIINIFLFQNYKIPTRSMENSLLTGDHLYVSKLAFGPKIPETPLSLPFVQNTIPGLNKKSYLEWIKWDYKRLKGFGEIERYNPVVFNCPALDSVTMSNPTFSYRNELLQIAEQYRMMDSAQKGFTSGDNYYLNLAGKYISSNTEIITRPVDHRENFIKRCVGLPGDSLQIIQSVLYVNGKPEKASPGQLKEYLVKSTRPLNKNLLKRLDIETGNFSPQTGNEYLINLNKEQVATIKKLKGISNVELMVCDSHPHFNVTYPNHPDYNWTEDNFGPIYIPQKGATVSLTLDILPVYSRIINVYEGNKLEVKDSTIFINGEIADSYTFKMNYYWLMGDNRHASWDSRNWGYVPEDHVIGRPRIVWLSIDKKKKFPASIRFKRMFHIIH